MLNGGGESIPYKTVLDFMEYLDVWEALQEQHQKDAEAKAKAQQQNNGRK